MAAGAAVAPPPSGRREGSHPDDAEGARRLRLGPGIRQDVYKPSAAIEQQAAAQPTTDLVMTRRVYLVIVRTGLVSSGSCEGLR